MSDRRARFYFLAMAGYWSIFGLGAALSPGTMNVFLSPEGVAASTAFSDHVWLHAGLDLLTVGVLSFGLSFVPAVSFMLRVAGVAALLPAVAVGVSVFGTPYWNGLFVIPGIGFLAFAAAGFILGHRVTASAAS